MSGHKCRRCEAPVVLRGRPPNIILCENCGGRPSRKKKKPGKRVKRARRRMSAPVASKEPSLIAQLETERDELTVVINLLRKRSLA